MNFESDIKNLNYNGYTILKNFFSKEECKNYIDMIEKYSNKEYGEKIKENIDIDWDGGWLHNLQNKDINFLKLIKNEYLEKILKYKLNDKFYSAQEGDDPNYILQLLSARSSGKNKLDIHVDLRGKTCNYRSTLGINILFYLDDSTIENGCTYIVPGSHLLQLEDVPYITDREFKNVLPIEVNAGDVLLFDQGLWHGAFANKTNLKCWRIQTAYNRWWIKPSFDMTRSLSNEVYQKLSDKEKLLFGYCSIPPKDEFERISSCCKYKDLKENI